MSPFDPMANSIPPSWYGEGGKPDTGRAKKSAGPMPNYRGAAEETAASSARAVGEQTAANRPNISTPFGSQQWTRGPNGEWQLNTALGGGLGEAAGALTGQAASALRNPFDMGPVGTGDDARKQAFDSYFNQSMSRLTPMWDRREAASRTRLANQGLSPDSEAARAEIAEFGRGRNDAEISALNAANLASTAAGDSVFRNNLASRNQALTERYRPVEELSGLQRFLAMPGFTNASAADPTNYFAATAAQGQWNQQEAAREQQFWNDLIGGIFGAGSSIATAGLLGKK